MIYCQHERWRPWLDTLGSQDSQGIHYLHEKKVTCFCQYYCSILRFLSQKGIFPTPWKKRCVYALELPHGGASYEYPQHISLWRNKKNIYLATPFTWSYDLCHITQQGPWHIIMLTAEAQIRVHTCTVWSAPFLFAYRVIVQTDQVITYCIILPCLP